MHHPSSSQPSRTLLLVYVRSQGCHGNVRLYFHQQQQERRVSTHRSAINSKEDMIRALAGLAIFVIITVVAINVLSSSSSQLPEHHFAPLRMD